MSLSKLQQMLVTVLRVLAIFVGGYALTGGMTALSGIGLFAAGMTLSDAMLLTSILGFLLYVIITMWGFSAPKKYWPATAIVVLASITMSLASVLAPV